jgi:hypothetical protein
MKNKVLIVDYETRSEVDLRLVGAYEYAAHPSTEILCACWSFAEESKLLDAPVFVWSAFTQSEFEAKKSFAKFYPLVTDEKFCAKRVAHNAFFEQCITLLTLPKYLKTKGLRWNL